MTRFLFKQPRHKRFSYQPRYYDADREDLQRRIESVKRELGQSEGGHNSEMMRGRLNHAWRSDYSKSHTKRSNRNVLIIAVLLFALVYVMFLS